MRFSTSTKILKHFDHFSRELTFANDGVKHFSRDFTFAILPKNRELAKVSSVKVSSVKVSSFKVAM